MKILFVGGTGIISTASAELAVQYGFDLTLLNRGRRKSIPGTRKISADISDVEACKHTLGNSTWDVVVDFISFQPRDLQNRLAIFGGKVGQFIFISSASAYQKPVIDYLVTESTPLVNPFPAASGVSFTVSRSRGRSISRSPSMERSRRQP